MGDIERAREPYSPDMSETTVHISLLETERYGLLLMNADLERQLAETRRALNRIARGAELQAHVMRDPLRTGGWSGAGKVADAFDDIADRARDALKEKDPPG